MAVKGAIDIVVNPRTPEDVRDNLNPTDEHFSKKTRQDLGVRNSGVPIDDYVRMMDRSGIERSLLIASRCGDIRVKDSIHYPYERVAELCAKHPDRLSGVAGIDPMMGMRQLRELEHAVKEFGFVGAHYYPHWFDIAPDHPYIFPVYAKCIELDIPIMIHVGHNLVYTRERRLPSIAKPISFDRIAILYPELRLIGIHLGVPWVDEMISMCWKHENIYMAGDAYAPKHWPPQVINYADSYGSDKFMFATDWPVIDCERAVSDVVHTNYKDHAFRKIMRENALKVFKLPVEGLSRKPKDWSVYAGDRLGD